MCLVGSYWLYNKLYHELYSTCQKIFPVCRFTSFSVPSWVSGIEGLLIASVDTYSDLKNLQQQRVKNMKNMKLRYYNQRMHESAFAIPEFLRQELNNSSKENLRKQQHNKNNRNW